MTDSLYYTHRERTIGSSTDEALCLCGLTRLAPDAEQGFRVLVWVRLHSSSLTKGALVLCCWLTAWEYGWVLFWGVETTAWEASPHDLCTLGPAVETLEISEMQSVSPRLGLHSTMLSGVTGVLTLR